jgi:hypothetical protein
MPILAARALFFGVEHEPRLHLPADAAQRRRCQHALGRAADAEIDVDAGFVRIGSMDHAGDIAVGNQADRGAGLAHRANQIGVARAIKDHRRDRLRFDTFGLGEVDDVVLGGRVEIDDALRIARADGNLVHVDSGACRRVPSCAMASVAMAPGMFLAQSVVPSSGSTAMSTLGPDPVPTFSPMNSIGASTISPSPITTVPSMVSALNSRRMASTAA